MRRDLKLIIDAAVMANGEIHQIRVLIGRYDNWLTLYEETGDPQHQNKALESEKLLRTFVLHRRRKRPITLRQLEQEVQR